ncbi:MAG: LPS-assembly protein LptD [Flavobacteriaceae bacterium]|nr:LPS-assembly protein LptD [Flavobacteriaceae bacterium]
MPKDSLAFKRDSLLIKKDSTLVKKDSIAPKNEFFEDIVTHTADSLIRQDMVNNRIYLYKNAHIKYMNYDLKAGMIVIDHKNNTIYAKGIDSVGKYSEKPVFKQGSDQSIQDSIIFNYKSKKAKTWNLKTKHQGLIISGAENKKYSDSIIFLKNIKITSSDKENPDYYIRLNKAKFIKDSKLVAGWSQLVIADVPTPAIVPFAYYPLTKGSSSGFLLPTWSESREQGYCLQNGGYYFAFNDYWDMSVMADIYTNGSWGIRVSPRYRVRYKYSGSLSFRYQKVVYSLKGFKDYSKRTLYNLSWHHSQDSKASPSSRFSASVDLGSSKYYRQSLNELDNNGFLRNTLSSSISYSKDFVGTPFHLNTTISHSQNTNTKQITMTLPSLSVSMDRQYPFAGKGGIKKNVFQKIGISYSMSGSQRLTTTDEDFLTKRMFKDAKLDVNHRASASTNMKLFKYFTVNPSMSYNEKWYFKGVNKAYDAETKKVEIDTVNRFGAYRTYSGSASLSTTLYGMFNFSKGKIQAIRHIIRPSISYNFTPDFSHYLKKVQRSDNPNDIEEYSPFLNGSVSRNQSQGVSISVSNNLEAKVRDGDAEEGDGKEGEEKKIKTKKITLLNNLNFGTSYNFELDSLRWSPVSMSGSTRLFKKLNLSFNATLDPYALSATGRRINKWNIQNGGSLFRVTNASLTASYSISSKDLFGKKDKKGRGREEEENEEDNRSEEERQRDRTGFAGKVQDEGFGEERSSGKEGGTEEKTAKLYRYNIPWNISFSYGLGYSNSNRQNEISRNSLSFNGNVELTPKWKVTFSSGYDFKRKGITHTNLGFARDLDSWRMTFNWSPTRDTYYFFIGIKSQLLSDLKYDKRKMPDKRLF